MSQPNMISSLHWYGHDSFRFDGPPVIYFDPWKLPAENPTADIILVSHDHYDHCSPVDVKKISGKETVVFASSAAAKKIPGAKSISPGETVTLGDVMITAVPAYNVNKFRSPGNPFHPRDAKYNGYVVSVRGERLYHAGDTDCIPEMSEIHCDVALLPVSGTYVMTAEEAFEAAKVLKPRVAVPMHFGDPNVAGTAADAERFRVLCRDQAELQVNILPRAFSP